MRSRADPKLGIAAPLLLSREEPGWIASAGISYSRRTGRMRQRASGRPVAALAVVPRAIDSVSGCVMLIRRSVFELTGLLDEEYFFSFEDIDFCLRAAEKGFRSACVEAAVAYHEGASTIGRQSPRRGVLRDPQSPETPVAPGRPRASRNRHRHGDRPERRPRDYFPRGTAARRPRRRSPRRMASLPGEIRL